MLTGGCHCGAVRYRIVGAAKHVTLCHCSDCRRSAGAPMVSWAGFDEAQFTLTQGAPTRFNSSGDAMRSFCARCGTGLFYHNATMLPGIVDVQTATLDDPDEVVPTAHIQVAERISWMTQVHSLPEFARFPPAG